MLLHPLEKLSPITFFLFSFAFFPHRFSHDINEIKIAAEESK